MKKIKTVNGWVIYQVQTQKAADKYNSEIGAYVRFSMSEIECYGLALAEVDIDYGNISLNEVIEDCKTSECGNIY